MRELHREPFDPSEPTRIEPLTSGARFDGWVFLSGLRPARPRGRPFANQRLLRIGRSQVILIASAESSFSVRPSGSMVIVPLRASHCRCGEASQSDRAGSSVPPRTTRKAFG